MKTSVIIDPKKIAKARELSGSKTLRSLIDEALDMYIARARRLQLSEMLGTDFFDPKSAPVRQRGRHRR